MDAPERRAFHALATRRAEPREGRPDAGRLGAAGAAWEAFGPPFHRAYAL